MQEAEQNKLAIARKANDEGMAAIQQGDAAGALVAFTQATQADPTAQPLWVNLAHANRMAQNSAGERTALEQALALDRLDFGAQLRMAQLLQRLGEETAALVAWGGVQQLAAHMPRMAPAIEAELTAGQTYCDALQLRIEESVQAALAAKAPQWDAQEQRRIAAFTDRALGRRQIFHNECAGLHYPFLPADEFFDRYHFPWLDELEANHALIKAELDALLAEPGEAQRPYVQMEPGTPQNQWSALDGSLDWSACFLWEYGKPNQVVLDRCPNTAALIERLPLAPITGRTPNVFFSILQPNSHIPPHTGVTNTRAIIHLALEVPPACGFRVGGETREWVEGKAFAFDDTIEHEAWNGSDKRRAVLILDCWNPHLSASECDAITQYYVTADKTLAGSGRFQ